MLRHLVPSALLAVGAVPAQTPAVAEPPHTVPEATGHTATSRAADVAAFLTACTRLPHGDRLTLAKAGPSHAGHERLLVRVALPGPSPAPRLRALVIGGIHGGEVEGKEALQLLAREFAMGEHEHLLAAVELWLLPIHNVDGNDRLGPGNRPGQNGPDAAGERANAQGLDLNRDFVKVDAPETRSLLRLFGELDPHLFVDLHTTNGSHHGYHLTYAPSLSPNVDPEIDRLGRSLLADAAAAIAGDGFLSFDYGNFETRDWDGGGAPESPRGFRGWITYDHRARYGINYFGLRNRIGVLSEAYSCADFATRIAVTRAFVLALLHGALARREEIDATARRADAALLDPAAAIAFGSATAFAPPERLPVLVGEVERVDPGAGLPVRFARRDVAVPELMPVVRAFRAARWRPLPRAWAILAPTPAVVDRLQVHGVQFAVAAGETVRAERFAVTAMRRPKRPFQGHQELVLDGRWLPAEPFELPPGTLIVSARQRLGRVAATLLEPESEDSLSTWNFFAAATDDQYPVLRVVD